MITVLLLKRRVWELWNEAVVPSDKQGRWKDGFGIRFYQVGQDNVLIDAFIRCTSVGGRQIDDHS